MVKHLTHDQYSDKKGKKRKVCNLTLTPLGHPPKSASKHVSKCMKGNKPINTRPELLLRKALWSKGIRGYRVNWRKVPGKPDICFPGRKIAIFVHGCFWHRCPKCKLHYPKTNSEYWKRKFDHNVNRDYRNKQELQRLGWKVLVAWECDIKKNIHRIVNKISKLLKYVPL